MKCTIVLGLLIALATIAASPARAETLPCNAVTWDAAMVVGRQTYGAERMALSQTWTEIRGLGASCGPAMRYAIQALCVSDDRGTVLYGYGATGRGGFFVQNTPLIPVYVGARLICAPDPLYSAHLPALYGG